MANYSARVNALIEKLPEGLQKMLRSDIAATPRWTVEWDDWQVEASWLLLAARDEGIITEDERDEVAEAVMPMACWKLDGDLNGTRFMEQLEFYSGEAYDNTPPYGARHPDGGIFGAYKKEDE